MSDQPSGAERRSAAPPVPAAGPGRLLAVDASLAVAVAGLWFLGLAVATGRGWRPVDLGAWHLAGVCLGLAVAVRRLAGPWLVAALVLAYPLVYLRPLVSYFHLMPVLVLGFAGAQKRHHLWAVSASCVLAVAIAFSPVVEAASPRPADVASAVRQARRGPLPPGTDPRFPPGNSWQANWSGLALAEFAVVSVILLGAAMASQRQVASDLAERNRELVRLRQVAAERAVADERLRISREVHDVVAHHLTAILMRAQAADRVHASRPEEAHAAVAWIAEESRAALRSTRATISSLRDPASPEPADGDGGTLADDLGRILDRVGQVGLDARLALRWDAEPPLDPAVGITVRRMVQEALTNVLKHADASEALVTLQSVRGGLGVQVVDNGTSAPRGRSRSRGGAGLLGMQERLAACGGRLRYGPTATGGWQVRLWVPIADRGPE